MIRIAETLWAAWIPGQPKPKTVIGFFNGARRFPHKGTRENSAYIKAFAAHNAPEKLIDGAVRLSLVFDLAAPKDKKAQRRGPTVKPDLKNLVAQVEDAFNGVIWTDDAIVVDYACTKQYSTSPPGISVHINRVEVT